MPARLEASMSHFFFIEENLLNPIGKLFVRKNDREYVVLAQSGGFTDIAQYCSKYQNVKVVTVRTENLDSSNRVA